MFPLPATSQQPLGSIAQPQVVSVGLSEKQADDTLLRIQYLEIVTPSVDETCETLEKAHGVSFGEPVAEFGNARTAELEGGTESACEVLCARRKRRWSDRICWWMTFMPPCERRRRQARRLPCRLRRFLVVKGRSPSTFSVESNTVSGRTEPTVRRFLQAVGLSPEERWTRTEPESYDSPPRSTV